MATPHRAERSCVHGAKFYEAASGSPPVIGAAFDPGFPDGAAENRHAESSRSPEPWARQFGDTDHQLRAVAAAGGLLEEM